MRETLFECLDNGSKQAL